MFDIMKVARNIKEARIAQNMTQMNLADAMEVSYQAVSNWERGNSMPDIAKLEQLCQILQISIDQLLGTEGKAKVVTKLLHKEEEDTTSVTLDEIEEIAPLLTPKEVKKLVNENLKEDSEQENPKKMKRSSALIGLAPFLGAEDLDELLQDLEEEMDIKTITSLAPFLSQHSVDELALRLTDKIGIDHIMGLVPFFSQECLEGLLSRCEGDVYFAHVKALAPFLSQESLEELLSRCEEDVYLEHVKALAPFLSQECLEETLSRCEGDIYLEQVMALAPFLSSKFLKNLVCRAKD